MAINDYRVIKNGTCLSCGKATYEVQTPLGQHVCFSQECNCNKISTPKPTPISISAYKNPQDIADEIVQAFEDNKKQDEDALAILKEILIEVKKLNLLLSSKEKKKPFFG